MNISGLATAGGAFIVGIGSGVGYQPHTWEPKTYIIENTRPYGSIEGSRPIAIYSAPTTEIITQGTFNPISHEGERPLTITTEHSPEIEINQTSSLSGMEGSKLEVTIETDTPPVPPLIVDITISEPEHAEEDYEIIELNMTSTPEVIRGVANTMVEEEDTLGDDPNSIYSAIREDLSKNKLESMGGERVFDISWDSDVYTEYTNTGPIIHTEEKNHEVSKLEMFYYALENNGYTIGLDYTHMTEDMWESSFWTAIKSKLTCVGDSYIDNTTTSIVIPILDNKQNLLHNIYVYKYYPNEINLSDPNFNYKDIEITWSDIEEFETIKESVFGKYDIIEAK